MECTIRWQPGAGMAFVAETGSGHLLAQSLQLGIQRGLDRQKGRELLVAFMQLLFQLLQLVRALGLGGGGLGQQRR